MHLLLSGMAESEDCSQQPAPTSVLSLYVIRGIQKLDNVLRSCTTTDQPKPERAQEEPVSLLRRIDRMFTFRRVVVVTSFVPVALCLAGEYMW
jgi:hypothetical protein